MQADVTSSTISILIMIIMSLQKAIQNVQADCIYTLLDVLHVQKLVHKHQMSTDQNLLKNTEVKSKLKC